MLQHNTWAWITYKEDKRSYSFEGWEVKVMVLGYHLGIFIVEHRGPRENLGKSFMTALTAVTKTPPTRPHLPVLLSRRLSLRYLNLGNHIQTRVCLFIIWGARVARRPRKPFRILCWRREWVASLRQDGELHMEKINTRLMKSCLSVSIITASLCELSVTVTKHLRQSTENREGLFWLTAVEVSGPCVLLWGL